MNQRVRVIRDKVLPSMVGREGVVSDTWDGGGYTVVEMDLDGYPYMYNLDDLEFIEDKMDFASLPDGTIIESSDFGDRYYKVSKHKWVVLTDEILSDPETYNTGGMEAQGQVFTVIG